jgi:drug/metabolite transporter (DMT)-like permease
MRSDAVKPGRPGRGAAVVRPGRLPLAAASVTVVLWASSFVAIRSAGQHFSPGALALGRLLAGTMVLGLISLGRRETSQELRCQAAVLVWLLVCCGQAVASS